jgi:SPOR domain
MKKNLVFCLLFAGKLFGQSDTDRIVIHKDPRVDQLIKKQIQINEETTRDSRRNIPGYRIQVINSNDRNKVFAVKTKVYQAYPELKSYLIYQAPNYKLKLGNFRTTEDAETYLQQLSKMFPAGVYIIRDIIEVKPEKIKEDE